MKKKIKAGKYIISDSDKVADAISRLIGSDYINQFEGFIRKDLINSHVTLNNTEADIQYLRGVADTLPNPDRTHRISDMLISVRDMLQSIGYEISDDEIKNSEV